MGNRLVKALRETLRVARQEHGEANDGASKRELALCVTAVEAALLRAMLACEHNGLRLLPADEA